MAQTADSAAQTGEEGKLMGVHEKYYRPCTFFRCIGKEPDTHSEACKQDWRNKILSYGVNDA